ncbi:serine/threonine-protein kinase [Tamaricihabitans halophyticus]|uniref:non-specific serine/threonine protein kinase n=1 Tax=Tamaricihabitans halophyticus TaxID=1262583 RepID=A0A4R2QY16_9PSEU|nr:Stk1 family PASTA domain-containing Ser/Thr kinase [Tamaricihabitans halophyticus]TCP54059.1 serine/threonine-protein kinase [Tamaricihabitans halophyticus]
MSSPRLLSNRYELAETIGYGGMSEVYHGRDVRLGREVAVKVLRADLARDPQFQERFRREAQNAAALNHPAIVAVFDTGETQTENGPLPYIVMEYVDGRTLRDIVKTEGPLSATRAMEVMADTCAALDFSHRHGIVHRDVKPANVMISRTGAVKVMDFGIARALHDGQASVTQTAAVIGTAQYLSPEQARGEKVDARSDVYAAGCVLFELLTGEPPFTGDSPVAVAYQHVREDPKPPSAVNPDVPPELDAIVLKALTKGAANRYQSSAEMRADIVRALSGQPVHAPMVMTDEDRTQVIGSADPGDYDEYDDYDEDDPERKKRRKGWLVMLLALLGVALLGVILWWSGLFAQQQDDNLAKVPDVQNQTVQAARETLKQSGFQKSTIEQVPCQPDENGERPCTEDQIDKVLSTRPEAGTEANKADEVLMRVGTAPEQTQVPDLSGQSEDEAKATLQEAGLRANPDTEEEETADGNLIGKVVRTDPQIGASLDKGSTVTLVLGKEQELIDVPNVEGSTRQEAEAVLSDAGFQTEVSEVDSAEDKGIVVRQQPNGAQEKPGATIKLEVSNAKLKTISMPALEGMTPQQAEGKLRSAGWNGTLDVQEREEPFPDDPDKIISQQPSAGSDIQKNQTVRVTVSKQMTGIPSRPNN